MTRKILSLLLLALSLVFAYAYYTQYFIRRACFNELGRCFDAETGVVYLEQSGAIWLWLAVLASALSLYLSGRLRISGG